MFVIFFCLLNKKKMKNEGKKSTFIFKKLFYDVNERIIKKNNFPC